MKFTLSYKHYLIILRWFRQITDSILVGYISLYNLKKYYWNTVLVIEDNP